MIKISDLHTTTNSIKILNGINLEIKAGEIHAIMGPNGSGKSTLAKTIMGHHNFKITKGDIFFKKRSILKDKVCDRAKKGIFLAFQHPKEITGIKFSTFLRTAQKAKEKQVSSVIKFNEELKKQMKDLHLSPKFTDRAINSGFSGGEKKKGEILQMQILKPKLIILDEIDSGLDIDALKKVTETINNYHNKNTAILIITHYQRILEYIQPNQVHVMANGKIMKSGNKEFAKELEKNGYSDYLNNKDFSLVSLSQG